MGASGSLWRPGPAARPDAPAVPHRPPEGDQTHRHATDLFRRTGACEVDSLGGEPQIECTALPKRQKTWFLSNRHPQPTGLSTAANNPLTSQYTPSHRRLM